jgi:hypothetical protein
LVYVTYYTLLYCRAIFDLLYFHLPIRAECESIKTLLRQQLINSPTTIL